MSTQDNKRKLDDAYGPTFDLQPDMMTEVFSHVQCVRTRHSLNRVNKLWRKASKTAAAYPLRFDFGAFPGMDTWTRRRVTVGLLDNDEALSLPYERVVGLLGEAAMPLRCSPGECKTAEVDAREQPCLECAHVLYRSPKWTIARSPVLARERVPLGLGHVLYRSPLWTLARSQVFARERVPLGLFHVP